MKMLFASHCDKNFSFCDLIDFSFVRFVSNLCIIIYGEECLLKLLTHYRNAFASQLGIKNWHEHDIGTQMIYSHRSTEYDRSSYPVGMHFHDYYEIVIFIEGDIRYICERNSCLPSYGDVIIIPPGQMHMSMLNADSTRYTRYVFYLYPDVFDHVSGQSLLGFLFEDRGENFMISLKSSHMEELLELLGRLDNALTRDTEEDRTLAMAYTIQIFYLLNKPAKLSIRTDPYFPQNVLDIQHYLDEHYIEVSSVSDVAAHFFYSREYVSRLFKKYLNTTVADYVLNRRVSYSQRLMTTDLSLIDICFRSGFGSVSAFSRAFQRITGLSPSKYRKLYMEKDD